MAARIARLYPVPGVAKFIVVPQLDALTIVFRVLQWLDLPGPVKPSSISGIGERPAWKAWTVSDDSQYRITESSMRATASMQVLSTPPEQPTTRRACARSRSSSWRTLSNIFTPMLPLQGQPGKKRIQRHLKPYKKLAKIRILRADLVETHLVDD